MHVWLSCVSDSSSHPMRDSHVKTRLLRMPFFQPLCMSSINPHAKYIKYTTLGLLYSVKICTFEQNYYQDA